MRLEDLPDDPPEAEPDSREPEGGLADWVERALLAPDVERALVRWLDRELKEDQYARLEQAGHSVEDAIPLAPVFIDLEALPGFVEDPPARLTPQHGFLYRALELVPRPMTWARWTVSSKPEGRDFEGARRKRDAKGLVLIGGPGQGKSTVGQLLCQVHRAALLAPRAGELPRDGQKALEALREQLGRDGVRPPARVLLPLRVVLRDFAAWMAASAFEPSLSLLAYLAHQIRRASGLAMDPVDLGQLLIRAPWLLLLDGLDEVPASAGREAMLGAVRELLQRLGNGGARGVVIATTRPQGYSGELGAFELESLYLAPLSVERALMYAERLVAVRYAGQPERQERIQGRLLEASKSPATARLMRTPLQVTILAALVDRFGRPPEERWGLFHGYFRVVYEREMERPGPVSDLLRSHKRHVEQIHARVGLLLQVETERSGGTAALMTRARLEQVVDATLAEDDDDPARRAQLTRTILDAAENRLVFLVSPQDGKIGFEIRSLQEMMAAWALADKTEAVVEARLTQIAEAASFRNVLLFVASRCFAERSDLRDAFTQRICPQLNEVDEVARSLLAGSMLALEILEDRSALSQPKHQRALASLALRLLELPPSEVHRRLALACTGDAEGLLRAALAETLGRAEPAERLSGWVALVALVDRGVEWAREIAERRWPEDTPQRQEVVGCASSTENPAKGWLQERIAASIESFPPGFLMMLDLKAPSPNPWFHAAHKISWHTTYQYAQVQLLDGGAPTPFSVSVNRIRQLDSNDGKLKHLCQAMLQWPVPPPPWVPWIIAARFATSTTAEELANGLDELTRTHGPRAKKGSIISWPLECCFQSNTTVFNSLSLRARAGELGDLDDWIAAEHRWEQGVDIGEIASMAGEEWPFSKQLKQRGFPQTGANLSPFFVRDFSDPWIERFLDLRAKSVSAPSRTVLALWILDLLTNMWRGGTLSRIQFSADTLESLWRESGRPFVLQALCPIAATMNPLELTQFLCRVAGDIELNPFPHTDELTADLAERISNAYCNSVTHHELLLILSRLIAAGARVHMALPGIYKTVGPTEPSHRAAAAIVRLSQNAVAHEDVEDLIHDLASDPSDDYAMYRSAAAITWHSVPAPAAESVLLSLFRQTPRRIWSSARTTVDFLIHYFKSRRSEIDDPATWTRLALPDPLPAPPPISEPPPSGDVGPIDHIEIRNLRLLEHLTLDPKPRDDDSGQWIILLGDNGVGKTTILRALALALVEPERATILLSKLPAHLRRRDAPTGTCRVHTRGGDFSTDIVEKGDLEVAQARKGNASHRPLIFGYGCRRGSALGGPLQNVSFSPPTLELATLFDESASLLHAETWLKERALEAEQNRGKAKEALFHAVLATLTDILPDAKKIEVRDNRVWVEVLGAGWVPLAALSDGYITTAGWVIDLVARWIDRATRHGEALEPSFTKTMEGLVLVDEIDLHLHPRWQCDVIANLRETFPKMSFVVTTHNPLTLLGAREGEIFVLRRARAPGGTEGPVTIEQVDLPKGARADQVLTGPWFGLSSTLDPDTLALLEQHRKLLRRRGVPDEERRALEARIRERLGSYADTSLDRLALSVAAELMDEQSRELSPDERASLRAELKQQVRARQGEGRGEGEG